MLFNSVSTFWLSVFSQAPILSFFDTLIAFLGPIFTGAKTGSISQASLSYSSGKLIEEIDLKNSLKKLALGSAFFPLSSSDALDDKILSLWLSGVNPKRSKSKRTR